MKNKSLFFISILYLFSGCKKGYEERIAPYVGTWKFDSYIDVPSYNRNANYTCVKNSFTTIINKDNTFVSFDTLGNKIFSGSLKSHAKYPAIFYIKNGKKSGVFIISVSYDNFKTCNGKECNALLGVTPYSKNNSTNKCIFFNGDSSFFNDAIFYKINK